MDRTRSPLPAKPAASAWDEAVLAFKRREYARAAELLENLAQSGGVEGLDPGALDLQLGVTLLRLGRTQEGLEALERAVALAPGDARAHQKLGAALGRLGRDQEAMVQFERAVALAPGKAEYQWRLGEQHRRLGRAEEARRALERALELDPGYAPASDGLRRLERGPAARLARLFRRKT